jgi:hypothetical protein
LLCDYADEVGGKLYIMGGGWSQVGANAPLTLALAVKLLIPWDQTNRPHAMRTELVTEDGVPVEQNGNPVQVEGQVEVGRPPGITPGTPIDAPIALRFNGLVLAPGRYRWNFQINDETIASASFATVAR